MDLAAGRIVASGDAGDAPLRKKWEFSPKDGDKEKYGDLLESLLANLFANRGSLRLDGNLTFEYIPKSFSFPRQLMSTDTAFFFHQMKERRPHANDDVVYMHEKQKFKAINKYMEPAVFENFMPEI